MDITVDITFDTTTKKFTYSDPYQTVVPGTDRLQFMCNVDYGIQFLNNQSPYKSNKPRQNGSGGTATGYKPIKDTNGELVPHKYTVAVYYAGDIYMDDPIIIVDDSGGGGGAATGGAKRGKGAKKKKASKK
jgi:hypothetical protein